MTICITKLLERHGWILEWSSSGESFSKKSIMKISFHSLWKPTGKHPLLSALDRSAEKSGGVKKVLIHEQRWQRWYKKFIFSNFHKFYFTPHKKKRLERGKHKKAKRKNLISSHLHDVIKLNCWLVLFTVEQFLFNVSSLCAHERFSSATNLYTDIKHWLNAKNMIIKRFSQFPIHFKINFSREVR